MFNELDYKVERCSVNCKNYDNNFKYQFPTFFRFPRANINYNVYNHENSVVTSQTFNLLYILINVHWIDYREINKNCTNTTILMKSGKLL